MAAQASRPLTAIEVKSIIGAVRGQNALSKLRNKLMITIGVRCAFRVSEVISLTVGDVRGKSEVLLRSCNTKGKKAGRPRRLSEGDIDLLNEYLVARGNPADDEKLFDLHRNTANKILKEAADWAGVDCTRVTFHSLRKAMATYIYNESGIVAAMKYLGHTRTDTTLHYLEIGMDEINDVAVSMDLAA